MENEPNTDLQAQADDATAEAVHKAKNAQAAIELARQAQLASAVEAAAQKTKDALLEGLKEVFGDSDSEDPTRMKVLVRRIPILCTNIDQMHADIADIKGNFKWGVRIVLGAVLLDIMKLILLP
jgi:hypothetical protein